MLAAPVTGLAPPEEELRSSAFASKVNTNSTGVCRPGHSPHLPKRNEARL
jgi:hypothetical protein